VKYDAESALGPTSHDLAVAPLFARVDAELRQELAELATSVDAAAGHCFVTEGSLPTGVFVVVQGEVEVTRRVVGGSENHAIRTLGVGQTFGELGLLEDLPASASIRTLVPTRVLVLPLVELRRRLAADARYQGLFRGLAEQLNVRLRNLTDVTVAALEREAAELRGRLVVGTSLIWLVCTLSAFTYSLGISRQLANARMLMPVTLFMCTLGLGAMGTAMRQTKLPAAFWGFTTKGWRPAVRDAVVFSLPIIAAMVVVKALLVARFPGWEAMPIFQWSVLPHTETYSHLGALALYLLVSIPLQEVISRGGMQGALHEFLVGPHRALWAILVSNLVFSVIHSFISTEFALLTLPAGMFWGWIYHRQRTLIGPILSHMLIGAAAFELMDVLGNST